MTLGPSLAGRDNALNFVRLILAAAVIVSHTWPLGGFGADPSFGNLSLGTWAVAGFFAISGYLISASRDRLNLRAFTTARVLRIFPAYWAALLAVAVVFAPVAALLTGTRVAVQGAAWYVLSNLTTYTVTPGFGAAIQRAALRHDTWNGAVWTLPYELMCYVVVGAAFCLRRVRVHAATFAVVGLMTVTAMNMVGSAAGFPHISTMLSNFVRMGAYFAAGAVLWALRDKVRVSATWVSGAALILLTLSALGRVEVIGALPLAYLVLAAGACIPVRWGQRTDLSYGLYVYGWPVQSNLSLAGAKLLGPLGFATVSLVGAGCFAVLSWRFVEAPALRLRSRVAGQSAARSALPSDGERAVATGSVVGSS